ncbi:MULTISPECIES: Ppx/GppA phosphatase family protein [unclassified Variovorax]|uniref:Ppx/GppA phosphatase family protein n=1 Tax=unclassified Variovorax TaxID=663243 RepID=UPI0025755699|nr:MULTISPECIES: Ppx/GppA phosphatase family protein [unclassified Variovorax]MDM0087692.1 Ppx/GppA phosphatase family protein [Variovorax sp. J22G40]MDM0144051.1 Ppx/GppA phosphatase family protein [Variovorax sp. J2P1-31]
MQNGSLLAAVDLGSNSFRLEIGRVDHGQIHRIEYLKEVVRQGAGLDSARNLTPEAMQRGWEALARFGERLAGFKRSQVRVVATQTLREARNRDEFLLRARTVLGFGIDVIPGREEARLIYQGVAHMLPHNDVSDRERRLVVDIGGRSTEMIIGRALEAQVMESYRVGSVAWSLKHFPQGQFTAPAFRAAEIAAKAVLDDALSSYGADRWDVAYGASGTIGAVGDILAASGAEAGVVTREGLDWLVDRLLKAGSIEKLRMDGMREDRKAVIGGGVSVLRAVFDLLDIREMKIAQGALRHGVLYELLERDDSVADLRAATVARLATRFTADAAQARRVGDTAASLYVQLDPAARGGSTASRAGRTLRKLGWAAQLHEIGALISHSDCHKHGAYILDNIDAPGFASNELHQLSQLVLGHRGKLRKIETALEDDTFAAQLLALRLAVILCHARRDPEPQALKLARSDARTFSVSYRPDWADAFPQSAHLLREEVLAWQKTGWKVVLGG